MATEVGHISGMLAQESDKDSPLTRQLTKLTSQILVISGTALVISIILNMSRGESFKTVFLAAIAFAIAAIPTGLPAVVTAILSMGTQKLAQANAIMKRLRSTETLGSTSAINSDKTGTLTLNQMTAVELTIGRRYTVDGKATPLKAGSSASPAGDVDLEQFMLPRGVRRRRARRRDDRRPDRGRTRRAGREGRLRLVGHERRTRGSRRAAVRHAGEATVATSADERRVGRDVVRRFVKGPGPVPSAPTS